MIPAAALAAVTTEELSNAATLYGSLKQLRLRMTQADEATLDRSFEQHIQNVLEKLDARLPSQGNPNLKIAEIVMARHGIYDASMQQAILLCQSISPALGDCLKEIRSAHSRMLSELQQSLVVSVGDIAAVQEEVMHQMDLTKEANDNCNKLGEVLDLLEQEAETNKAVILDLRQQLRSAKLDFAKTQDALAATPYSAVKTGTAGTSTPKKPAFDTSPIKPTKRNNYVGGGGSEADVHSASKTVAAAAPKLAESWLYSFRSELQRAIDENRCREMSLKALKDYIEKLYESKEVAVQKLAQGTGNTAVETMEMHLYSTLEKKYGLRSIAAEQAGMILLAVDKYATEDNYVNVFHKIFRNEIEDDFWMVQKELIKSIKDLTMVQLMSRYPTKDQPTLLAMLDQKVSEGNVSEEEWTDMINYLYNNVDSTAICMMLKKLAVEEMSAHGVVTATLDDASNFGNSSSPIPLSSPVRSGSINSSRNTKHSLNARTEMTRRLGYNSPSLKAQQQQQQIQQQQIKSRNGNVQLRLSFAVFLKCVLDFQLKSRLQYLSTFRAAFEHFDRDFDGVLAAAEFRDCYLWLRAKSSWLPPSSNNRGDIGEDADDEHTIMSLLRLMDPRQTDRITYSVAATTISKAAAAAVAASTQSSR